MQTKIEYNGSTVINVLNDKKITIPVKDKKMSSDIVIKHSKWIGDGNTHLWVSLSRGYMSPMVGVGVNGTVTVDWGDGTKPDVLTGTDIEVEQFTPQHNYKNEGDYVVTLIVEGEMAIISGKELFDGLPLLWCNINNISSTHNYGYTYTVKKIEIGNNVSKISDYSMGYSTLESVFIGNDVISIGEGAFGYLVTLFELIIGNHVSNIGRGAFAECTALKKVEFPSSVTNIEDQAFILPYATVFDFSQHTFVPTIGNIVFAAIGDCNGVIRVPKALENEWKNTENWFAYADHIVGV